MAPNPRFSFFLPLPLPPSCPGTPWSRISSCAPLRLFPLASSRVSFVPTNRPLSLLLFYSPSLGLLGPSACFSLPFCSFLLLALSSSLSFFFSLYLFLFHLSFSIIFFSLFILSYPPLYFLASFPCLSSLSPFHRSFRTSCLSSVLSHLGRQLSKRSKEVLLLLLLPSSGSSV